MYFSWTKLDPAAAETKALVTQYWKWEGTDKDGRKFNQERQRWNLLFMSPDRRTVFCINKKKTSYFYIIT